MIVYELKEQIFNMNILYYIYTDIFICVLPIVLPIELPIELPILLPCPTNHKVFALTPAFALVQQRILRLHVKDLKRRPPLGFITGTGRHAAEQK